MIHAKIHEILDALKEKGFQATLQEETQQVFIIFKLHEAEFPLFVKVVHDGDLLQILMFIPSHLDKNHANDVARLMHYVNKEMDLPGFGYDELNQMMYYRLLLPTQKKKIDVELLLAFVNAAKLACETFAPMIQSVNLGKTRFKDILEKTSGK